jgi:Kef-type K+ transport system membrane component KefB
MDDTIALLLLDAALLLVLGRCVGALLGLVGQPQVLGEIMAGILLGPSLLGLMSPAAFAELFPSEVMALLVSVGNVGLVVFVFLVGLGIDRSVVRRRLRQVTKIAAGSFVVPFGAGVLVAVPLYEVHMRETGAIGPVPFALFVGTALSVTAFPVLARIVSSQKLERSTLGAMSLAAAGMLDLVGWVLLAAILTLAAGDGGGDLALRIAVLVALGAFVVRIGAPLLCTALARLGGREHAGAGRLPLLAAAILACAGATQLLGVHSVLGALLLGLALPRERFAALLAPLRRELSSVSALLLPFYFAVAGMGVDLTSLDGGNLLELGALLVAATAAKVGGTMLGARWAGFVWREALPFGVLMNTRGLMEVVVLNVGLSAGLLDVALYSELMVVTLVATFMTTPAIQWLRRKGAGPLWRDASRAEPELGLGLATSKSAS